MSHDPGKQTHFGFREVPETEKAGLVGEVFSSVASRYDIMNDLMSLGVHRLWKRFAVSQSGLRAGDQVLDVAAGSGDLSQHFASRVGSHGKVVLTDINEDMLAQGRTRMVDRGLVGNIEFMIADAEDLPLEILESPEGLQIGGVRMSGSTFSGMRVGIRISAVSA